MWGQKKKSLSGCQKQKQAANEWRFNRKISSWVHKPGKKWSMKKIKEKGMCMQQTGAEGR